MDLEFNEALAAVFKAIADYGDDRFIRQSIFGWTHEPFNFDRWLKWADENLAVCWGEEVAGL